MKAIISDIHANLEALEAVMADLDKRNPEEIFCLGDIVGYGPNPRECIEICKRAKWSLLGNHEEAVLFHAEDFNAKARRAVDWTREQLNSSEYDRVKNNALWDYLGDLKKKKKVGDILFVHGSPRQPTREYVLPKDAEDTEKMTEIFDGFDWICFAGHTHIAGVFYPNGDKFDFRYAAQLANEYKLARSEGKRFINVGSIGQPRDGDNRACYVTYDDEIVRFHRIEYDYKTTMKKIYEVEDLADYLAKRLEEGR
ncbi:MAG: metallophosphoesterase family protein [Planctomycetes bacterium]|nr:metallophosphoesterase family protein [Planctomycetota bacterium]